MIINKKLTINSAGKINLYLNVAKDLRPDGYHEIKSIMQSVSLYDELHFDVSTNSDLKATDHQEGDEASGDKNIMLSCNNIDIPLNEKNLVHKAAYLVMKKYNLGKKYSIRINIKKRIPVGAGLAGGSTNAAATLLALDRLFNLKLSGAELIDIGNQVGSDVPFCISGGTALIEGKGEIISKLPDLPFYWVVLAINGKKFSSGDVYDKFDLVGKSKKAVHKKLLEKLANRQYREFFTKLDNDLERVVVLEDKMVNILKDKALESGAFASMMTGSGPAIFAFCEDLVIAKKVYAGLGEISNKVYLTYTTPNSQNFLN